MTFADTVNGTYETIGGFFLLLNVIKTYKDKEIKGLSVISMIFFTSWGYWNLYYYPSLNQWLSFVGGAILVIFNTIWVGQAVYYTKHPELATDNKDYKKLWAEAVRDMIAIDGCWEKKLERANERIKELENQ